MDLLQLFTLIFFASSIAVNVDIGQKFHGNFWQSLGPGELLNALDLMTIDDAQNQKFSKTLTMNDSGTTTVIPSTTNSPRTIPKPRYTKAIPLTKKRMIVSEDNSGASNSNERDNYEQAYEEFVRRYFDDAANHYISSEHDGNNSGEDASNLSSEASYESEITTPLDAQPFATTTKKQNSKRECRKTHKKREVCIICKNPRTGERSETCSYERASEPESYAYKTKRKYKKSRDRDSGKSAESDSNSSEESSKSKTKNKSPKTKKPSKRSEEASSSCIKRIIGNNACYNCRNSENVKSVKCFPLKVEGKKNETKKGKPLKIDNNTHQKRRIYKRTLSYVYEKGLDSNDTLPSLEDRKGNFTKL